MTHRPGHISIAGDGTMSMDRRKYLSTLAAGAAFGTVAAGLAACGSKSSSDDAQESDSAVKALTPAEGCVTFGRWGTLSIFPPGILTLEEARANMPAPGSKMITVPFFNSNGIDIKEGMVVGFHLVRIGCPTQFVVAFNLEDHDHPIPDSEREWYIGRNNNMDNLLKSIGYSESEWVEPSPKPCEPPLADDWSK
jgi:hypothetical protein